MPGTRCTVSVCNNSSVNVKKSGKHISFYRFPKNPEIRQIWIKKCKRGGKWNWESCRVCSEHFTIEDYEYDWQAELFGLPPKKKLKAAAVPSLKLSEVPDQELVSTQNSEQTQRTNENREETILEIVRPSKSNNGLTTVSTPLTFSASEDTKISLPPTVVPSISQTFSLTLSKVSKKESVSTENSEQTHGSNENLVSAPKSNNVSTTVSAPVTFSESEDTEDIKIPLPPILVPLISQTSNNIPYDVLQEAYQRLILDNEFLKKHCFAMKEQNDELKLKANDLERDLNHLSAKLVMEKSHRAKIENSIKQILTKAQRDIIIDKKKMVVWSAEDRANAFAIRYFSKRCYVYLRETKKYPLPSISSLQRWASELKLRQGVLDDIFRIMSITASEMSDFEKVGVIQFGEVKVNSLYEYDASSDEVIGPHSHMQVVMARGLFSKWKQPIFIDFDQEMTKDILLTLIKRLHETSYNVVACVSDCSNGNVGLWEELGVDKDHSYFTHPVTEQKINFFADAPDILKLVRNWLIDNGFILGNGAVISIEPLRQLILSTDSKVSSSCKISKKHLECIDSQHQNVTLAAQLLSHNTATALKHYQPGPDKKLAIDLGDFIEKINKWFDIYNSYTNSTSIASKRPYGVDLKQQDTILEEVWHLISTMKCTGKSTLQIFQEGLLMSISSLRSLFSDMKERYGAKYILTHKINQDSLKNFFCQLHGQRGLNDHPTPLDAIHRIRMIILGKNPGMVKKNMNTISQNLEDEYIVAKVLSDVVTDVPCTKDELQFFDTEITETCSSDMEPLRCTQLNKICESDTVEHLAGWVAYKLKHSHPGLGDRTYESQIEHAYQTPKWVSHLLSGGFMQPSQEWKKQAQLLNKTFEEFHKDDILKKGPNITEKLLNIIKEKYPDSDLDAAKSFIRQRLFIRIKYLNEVSKEDKATNKRPHSDKDVHNKKLFKKRKKAVN